MSDDLAAAAQAANLNYAEALAAQLRANAATASAAAKAAQASNELYAQQQATQILANNGVYKMQCWQSTIHPETHILERLVYDYIRLFQAIESEIGSQYIVSPSQDSSLPQTCLEICFMWPTGQVSGAEIPDLLNKTAQRLNLSYQNFVADTTNVVVEKYTPAQVANIKAVLSIGDFGDNIEDRVRECFEIYESVEHMGLESWRTELPYDRVVSQVAIARDTFDQLQQAEGDLLEQWIKYLLDKLTSQMSSGKTAFDWIRIIASGIWSIPNEAAKIWSAVKAFWAVWKHRDNVWDDVKAIVELAEDLKWSRNILLICNDTSFELLPKHHDIANEGLCMKAPYTIGPTQATSNMVTAAFFVYNKEKIAGLINDSKYGSQFGLELQHATQGAFSIGMDCPEWERNSIVVQQGNDALRARVAADESSSLDGSIEYPQVKVRIAHNEGGYNYGWAILQSTTNSY